MSAYPQRDHERLLPARLVSSVDMLINEGNTIISSYTTSGELFVQLFTSLNTYTSTITLLRRSARWSEHRSPVDLPSTRLILDQQLIFNFLRSQFPQRATHGAENATPRPFLHGDRTICSSRSVRML